MEFKTKEISRVSHVVSLELKKNGDYWKVLTISDIHFDSPKCLRGLLKKHLDEAKENGWGIIINGDLFDAMQTTRDPRGNYSDIRPEYKEGIYLDLIVEDAAKFFAAYAENIIIISAGNHETAMVRFHNTDIIDRLCQIIYHTTKIKVYKGGYSGWITFRFNICGSNLLKRLKYHHGHGGGRRSKGILSVDIDAAKWSDASIIIKGHDHQKWYYPLTRQRIDQANELYKDVQTHLRLGSYKDGMSDAFQGYEVERDFQETTPGGWFIKFTYERAGKDGALSQKRINISVEEA